MKFAPNSWMYVDDNAQLIFESIGYPDDLISNSETLRYFYFNGSYRGTNRKGGMIRALLNY